MSKLEPDGAGPTSVLLFGFRILGFRMFSVQLLSLSLITDERAIKLSNRVPAGVLGVGRLRNFFALKRRLNMSSSGSLGFSSWTVSGSSSCFPAIFRSSQPALGLQIKALNEVKRHSVFSDPVCLLKVSGGLARFHFTQAYRAEDVELLNKLHFFVKLLNQDMTKNSKKELNCLKKGQFTIHFL